MICACPMCGQDDVHGTILRHLGDVEARIDRGQEDLRGELTTQRIVERFELNPSTAYRNLKDLTIAGLVQGGGRVKIAYKKHGQTYILTPAGRAVYQGMRSVRT